MAMTGTRQILFILGGGEGTHDEWDHRLVDSLRREPDALAILGIACVVVAGIGAERTGGRELVPAPG